jgi:hypothetical protein
MKSGLDTRIYNSNIYVIGLNILKNLVSCFFVLFFESNNQKQSLGFHENVQDYP